MLDHSPAPRTPTEVARDLHAALDAVTANKAAATTRTSTPNPGAEKRLALLQDEYDETEAGQAALAARLNSLENSDSDSWVINTTLSRMYAAAARRDAKVAATRSIEEGNHNAATYQLRYGAHAGWLAHARLPKESAKGGGFHIYSDYAIGQTYRDAHTEQSGYDHYARDLLVVDQICLYEAIVTPGLNAGTWVTGTHGQTITPSHRSYGAHLGYSPSPHTASANLTDDQVRPVLYNQHDQTVSWIDPHTHLPFGPAVDVTTLESLRVLDHRDALDLAETFNKGYFDTGRATPLLRQTPDGDFLLSVEFDFSLCH